MSARGRGDFHLDLGVETAEKVRQEFAEAGLTIKQGFIQAFKVWKWVRDTQKDGNRLIAIRTDGDTTTQRELTII